MIKKLFNKLLKTKEPQPQKELLSALGKSIYPYTSIAVVLVLFYLNLVHPPIPGQVPLTILGLLAITVRLVEIKILYPSPMHNRYWSLLAGLTFSILTISAIGYTGGLRSPWFIVLYLIDLSLISTLTPDFPIYVSVLQSLLLGLISFAIYNFQASLLQNPLYSLLRIASPLFFGLYARDSIELLSRKKHLLNQAHQVTRRLREERIRVNGVFQSIREAIVLTNEKNTVLLLNRKAREFFPHLKPGARFRRGSDEDFTVSAIEIPDASQGEEKFIYILQNKQQEELSRIKLDFLNMIAHKLRTPLTHLQSYLAVLREDSEEFSPEVNDIVDKIEEGNRELAQGIEDLLETTAQETGS